jgi:hypothetical protein
LIKLVPEQFDQALRERLAREHEAEDRDDAEVAAAIARVYGTSEAEAVAEMHQARMAGWGENGAEMGRLSRHRKQVVERWMVEWALWLAVGREALEQHRQHQPHRRLSLGTVARLLDLASALGRLNTGCALRL